MPSIPPSPPATPPSARLHACPAPEHPPRPAALAGCVYMPHFAAWAAGEPRHCRDGAIVHARDRVVAASPAYLRQGARAGLSLHRARTLFPRACFLSRDLPAEQLYADRLLERLYQLTPQVNLIQDRHLTGCWIAVQGFAAADLRTVLQEYHAQGGCAALQSHALLAALYGPAGQLHTLADVAAFLRRASIQPLAELGIAPRTLELLHWVGIRTLAELHRLTQRHLQAQFGKEGRRLFALLHPSSHPIPVPHHTPRSLTVSRDISWEPGSIQDFQPYLIALVHAGCKRTPAMAPTWLRLKLTPRGGHGVERFRALKPPYGRNAVLHGPALHLLQQGLTALTEDQRVHQLELTLGGLIPAVPAQGTLFPSRPGWHAVRPHLLRRFPHRFFQPVRTSDAPFLPEEEFSLGALTE